MDFNINVPCLSHHLNVRDQVISQDSCFLREIDKARAHRADIHCIVDNYATQD
jgi:hypothetical protein